MASGVASKGTEVPEPTFPTMLSPRSASRIPVFNLGSTAPRSGAGKPIVFSIGGATPRSSNGKDSTGKDAAGADPIHKIFTTHVLDNGFPEASMREMLLAVAEDSSAGSTADFSSRGCWVSKEDNDAIQVKADMPGLGKEHVKVRVEKDALMIKGEGDKVPARYSYRIGLPSSQAFKMDQIKAEMKNGVLMVTVPKIKDEER